jgi:hypothetical protein
MPFSLVATWPSVAIRKDASHPRDEATMEACIF